LKNIYLKLRITTFQEFLNNISEGSRFIGHRVYKRTLLSTRLLSSTYHLVTFA